MMKAKADRPSKRAEPKPWYREPWPWALLAGPALTVVGGGITLWLALATHDGLVADDYYRQGLAINQTLARDAAAARRGYRARILFDESRNRVQVRLAGAELPAALVLRLAHPTRAGLDRSIPLTAAAPGLYTGGFAALPPGRWRLSLEDAEGTWRLTGTLPVPGTSVLEIGP